jgi:hypothetical protein
MAKGKIDSPANNGGKGVFTDPQKGAVKAKQGGYLQPSGSKDGTGCGKFKS